MRIGRGAAGEAKKKTWFGKVLMLALPKDDVRKPDGRACACVGSGSQLGNPARDETN